MTNAELLAVAMRQSAIDLNAQPSDFQKQEAVFVRSGFGAGARKYYREPIACNLVSYGSNIVASVRDEVRAIVEAYVGKYSFCHCFETPNLLWLDERMRACGWRVCFMAEFFLPDMNVLKPLESPFPTRVLQQPDFAPLYTPEWSNALCEDRKELDVLGIGAYDGGKLIGLAACSADCDDMWQIGIDVLPEYRRQGIASALTSRLALEILERGKVPFYCSAWSNLPSVKNALRSGFAPAWAELTVKSAEKVAKMNR